MDTYLPYSEVSITADTSVDLRIDADGNVYAEPFYWQRL